MPFLVSHIKEFNKHAKEKIYICDRYQKIGRLVQTYVQTSKKRKAMESVYNSTLYRLAVLT